jgi:hypothetical protein
MDQCERVYQNFPAKIPTVKLNLPVGHMGTYGSVNGGLFGKVAVAFFECQLKGVGEMANWFLQPLKDPELVRDGWEIVLRAHRPSENDISSRI